jgi:hypothetical protein
MKAEEREPASRQVSSLIGCEWWAAATGPGREESKRRKVEHWGNWSSEPGASRSALVSDRRQELGRSEVSRVAGIRVWSKGDQWDRTYIRIKLLFSCSDDTKLCLMHA